MASSHTEVQNGSARSPSSQKHPESSLALDLGRFVARIDAMDVPEEALATAQRGFTDYLGVMVAGRDSDAARILRETVNPDGGEATVCAGIARASALDAALINGASAHAFDFDDQGLNGHPSTVLASAILPEGEAVDADGPRLLLAYVAGYETWAELIHRERGFHQNKGWHPTGVLGAVGAAAGCSVLRGLDVEQTANALGIAASMGAGLAVNFGTMTKPLHAGRAANAGILAARLAERGFTASSDVFENPRGLLFAISPDGDLDLDGASSLGENWRIVTDGLNIKRYPSCYCGHRVIDGVIETVREGRVRASDVDSVVVDISETFAAILLNHTPQTAAQARFSIEFAVAGALVEGRLGLGEFSDDIVQRDEVQTLMRRVTVRTNTDYDPSDLGASRYDRVTFLMRDGSEVRTRQVRRTLGHSTNPLSEEQRLAKFRDCFAYAGMGEKSQDYFERFSRMEDSTARELLAS